MATREAIATALFTQLKTIASFHLTGRRLFEPSAITVALSPALFLVESSEVYYNASPQSPPKRTLKYVALIYNNVGGSDVNAVPATIVNNALDALDALFVSIADPVTARVTLGGLVYHVRIEGDVVMAPGETTGLAMAAVPLEIVVP